MSEQSNQISYRFSSSRTGSKYSLTLSKDGSTVYCSCPAWRNQKIPSNKRICRHIKLFEEKFIIDETFCPHDGMVL